MKDAKELENEVLEILQENKKSMLVCQVMVKADPKLTVGETVRALNKLVSQYKARKSFIGAYSARGVGCV